MSTPTIVFAVSAATHWELANGQKHACGFWPEELAAPHKIFTDNGFHTVIATPNGLPATPDESGYAGPDDPWRTYIDALQPSLQAPTSIGQLDPNDIAALFIPGGYAPMQDLPTHAPLGTLIQQLHDRDRPIAAVCHGPVALLATRADGVWPFTGKRMTCFSNAEEREVGIHDSAPWLGETALRQHGGVYSAAPPWQQHVVSDGNLHTGQNPASAAPLAHEVLSSIHANAGGAR